MGVVRWFGRWFGRHRNQIAYLILIVAFTVPNYGYYREQGQRRHDNCVSRLHLYDGITGLGNLVGHAFNAPQAEIDRQLKSLKLGPRPNC